jgi:hypothetical protein
LIKTNRSVKIFINQNLLLLPNGEKGINDIEKLKPVIFAADRGGLLWGRQIYWKGIFYWEKMIAIANNMSILENR